MTALAQGSSSANATARRGRERGFLGLARELDDAELRVTGSLLPWLQGRYLRIDLDSGAVTTWQRPGAMHLEPLFVPRPGGSADDDGVLLVPTLADDDDASVIGVVDAASMRGLAQIQAPQVLPFGIHAAFMPA